MPNKLKTAAPGEVSKVHIGVTDEELYSIRKLAALTNQHQQTWRNRIARGEIKAIDISRPGALRQTLRIRRSVLEAWVAKRPEVKAKVKVKAEIKAAA